MRLAAHTTNTIVTSAATMAHTPKPTTWAECPAANSPTSDGLELSCVSAWTQPRQINKSAMTMLMMVRRQDRAVRSGCSPGSLDGGGVGSAPSKLTPGYSRYGRTRIRTAKMMAATDTTTVMPSISHECGSSASLRIACSWCAQRL